MTTSRPRRRAGVCRTDLHLIDGWFADVMPADVPFTLGHETAGWVEAVGLT
jgi:NAD+-dependent secondary alcohol dehydrogenase Adh1